MDSCSPNRGKVFDSLRNIWVAATPEECVRQKLLLNMTQRLGYPKQLISVEKELGELPHLQEKKCPDRRIDILCFGKDIHPAHALYPLLLIECKKEKLTTSAKEQLLGYNSWVGAYFIAVCGPEEMLFGFKKEESEWEFLPFLPPYGQLISQIKKYG